MSQRSTPAPCPPWQRFALTEGLDLSALERLAALATPAAWDAGAVVYREGDAGSPLYLVEEGRVAIEIAVPGRGQMIVLTVGPGELFGWSSLFSDRPKGSAARTAIASRGWALDTGRLRALCDDDPVLGYALTRRILHAVSERLKQTRIQLIDLYRT
jgi:CRP-like cAMP-binding protein